ncbi:hypothetical protein [Lederbergia graminis]|uniref:Uncharacterized protein n=1 Tax=Lederbergia graminis TaxID=735518 RepID=A0ABW0LGC5_9BACI
MLVFYIEASFFILSFITDGGKRGKGGAGTTINQLDEIIKKMWV